MILKEGMKFHDGRSDFIYSIWRIRDDMVDLREYYKGNNQGFIAYRLNLIKEYIKSGELKYIVNMNEELKNL